MIAARVVPIRWGVNALEGYLVSVGSPRRSSKSSVLEIRGHQRRTGNRDAADGLPDRRAAHGALAGHRLELVERGQGLPLTLGLCGEIGGGAGRCVDRAGSWEGRRRSIVLIDHAVNAWRLEHDHRRGEEQDDHQLQTSRRLDRPGGRRLDGLGPPPKDEHDGTELGDGMVPAHGAQGLEAGLDAAREEDHPEAGGHQDAPRGFQGIDAEPGPRAGRGGPTPRPDPESYQQRRRARMPDLPWSTRRVPGCSGRGLRRPPGPNAQPRRSPVRSR